MKTSYWASAAGGLAAMLVIVLACWPKRAEIAAPPDSAVAAEARTASPVEVDPAATEAPPEVVARPAVVEAPTPTPALPPLMAVGEISTPLMATVPSVPIPEVVALPSSPPNRLPAEVAALPLPPVISSTAVSLPALPVSVYPNVVAAVFETASEANEAPSIPSLPRSQTPQQPTTPPPLPEALTRPSVPAPEIRLPAVPPPTLPIPRAEENPALAAPRSSDPLPQPTPLPAAASANKVVLLSDGKMIEGIITVIGEKVIVRHGALDRPFPAAQIAFIAADKDEVYRFLLKKIPVGDVPARLKLARWCLFSGMRSQALEESRAVLKIDSKNAIAIDMIRSLEESLRRYPEEGKGGSIVAPTPTPPPATAVAKVSEAEFEIPAEAAINFPARVQPILSNLCASCHSRGEYAGTFKITQTEGFEVRPEVTARNLKAVLTQVRREDPGASPLLMKAAVAHGGMTQPAFTNRQVAAFRVLEYWTHMAADSTAPPQASLIPPAAGITPSPNASALPPPPFDPKSPLPMVPRPQGLPPMDSAVRPSVPTNPMPKAMIPGSPPPLPTTPPPPDLPPAPSSQLSPPSPPTSAAIPKFGQNIKPTPPTGPNPANTGAPVDDFDPSVFNRAGTPASMGK